MKKQGKKFTAAAKLVEERPYTLEEAVPLVQKAKFAKFDETVELHLRLGVDPKHADQMVRGTIVLPNGLGKNKKVLVIASGDKLKEAGFKVEIKNQEARGGDLHAESSDGKRTFDVVVAKVYSGTGTEAGVTAVQR